MAPVSTDNDLLDDALKNKTILPSWRSIFTRLTSPNTPSTWTVSQVSNFLFSKSAVHALQNCHNPFPPPSAASKQEFEKRTAPINFTAADQPGGDASGTSMAALPPIAELKAAALDLSQALNIDEVSALRIVVLEHHARPAKALLAAEGGTGGDVSDPGAGGFGLSMLESMFRPSPVDDQKEKEKKIFVDRVEVYLAERRYVVKVATALLRAMLVKDPVWGEAGQQFVRELTASGWMEFATKLVEGVRTRWFETETGRPGWVNKRMQEPEVRDRVAYTWEKQVFLEIIHLLQLVFLLLYSPPPSRPVSPQLAIAWFELVREAKFFTKIGRSRVLFPVEAEIKNLYTYTGGLASIISVAMLQIPATQALLDQEFLDALSPGSSATPPATGTATPTPSPSYIKDPKAIATITNCLQECAGNIELSSLAVMGWTCLLTRIHQDVQYALHWDDGVEAPARGPPVVELYNSLLPDLFPTTVEVGLKQLSSLTTRQMLEAVVLLLDPAQRSSDTAFCLWWEEDGLRMKNVVADLMRQTLGFFEFHSALIVAMHLAHDVEYSKIPAFNKFLEQEAQLENEQPSYTWIGSPAKKFLQDDGAMKLLERAKNRFPHEPLPFLRLLRCLATQPAPVVEYLTHLPTCTQALPQYFGGLEDVEPEDEDAPRRVILTTELVLFPPRQSGMFECEVDGQTGTSGGIFIPPGTEGVYLADGTRPVVAWRCEYNALALLGRMLECAASGETGVGPDLVNKEVVTEIVSLLTTLVASSPEARAAEAREPGHYEPPQVLAEASELMNRTRDVVSVVFDLLDSALNSYTVQNPFFVVGLEFVTSLVHVAPGRVWPYLARSVLLERNGRGGAFSGYLSSVEVTQGSYDFTLACLTLYEKLVEEAIRGSAAQRGSTKSLVLASKSAPQGPGGVGVSDMVQREILVGFTRTVVDILESYRSFKYAKDIAQKLLIGAKITSVFTQSLYYVYGVDDISDPAHKITGVLVPSAEYLVAVFLSASDSDLPIEPISGGITDGVQTPESSLYLQTLGLWKEQVIQIVRFADMLVRVRLYLGREPSYLEKQLYTHAAPIAKLYGADELYKRYVLELFESLVKSSGSFPEEPPSLLGHLGSDCANHFVTLLSMLDKPYQDEAVETKIWNFISAVVSNKQQGMSILLLKGESFRKGKTADNAVAGRKKSMLAICYDALDEIDRLPVEKTLAMLEMVSTAQNFWSLAMDDVGKHPKLLPALTKHVEHLTIEFLPSDSKEIITEKACKIAVAAYISKILALFMHSRPPSERDQDFFAKLLPQLNFYFEKAVKIGGYRPSLHLHLQKNFEEKWPGTKLIQLKKTRLRRTIYGPNAVYDVELGDKILGFDPGWDGRSDGYRNEVEQANLNLSLVQTQVDLLASWELLAVELCEHVKSSKELTESLVKVVQTCLLENVETGLPAAIYNQILARRAEFAFVIVRKLHQALPDADLFSHIFKIALKAIDSSPTEFRHALATADMDYYRSLLRIIYVSLTAAVKKEKHSLEFGQLVIALLDLVVAQGFKDLVQGAHQYPERANPQDIALINAILQAALRIQNLHEIHHGLANHLHEHQTIRAATTLFSWAEQLAGEDGDPVYGELAVLFLLELSSVPLLAEQLALENILELLESTTLAARITQSGVTPLGEPRLHAIWSRGLLPLALNLLVNIGVRYGREIIGFLRYFHTQIKVAIEGWRKPSVLVLPAVNESVTIAMIIAIITKMGGKAELVTLGFDFQVVIDGVDYLLTHKNYLKSLVAPTNEEEEMMLARGDEEGGLVDVMVNQLMTLQALLQEDVEE